MPSGGDPPHAPGAARLSARSPRCCARGSPARPLEAHGSGSACDRHAACRVNKPPSRIWPPAAESAGQRGDPVSDPMSLTRHGAGCSALKGSKTASRRSSTTSAARALRDGNDLLAIVVPRVRRAGCSSCCGRRRAPPRRRDRDRPVRTARRGSDAMAEGPRRATSKTTQCVVVPLAAVTAAARFWSRCSGASPTSALDETTGAARRVCEAGPAAAVARAARRARGRGSGHGREGPPQSFVPVVEHQQHVGGGGRARDDRRPVRHASHQGAARPASRTPPRRGAIRPRADADATLFDPAVAGVP